MVKWILITFEYLTHFGHPRGQNGGQKGVKKGQKVLITSKMMPEGCKFPHIQPLIAIGYEVQNGL